MAGKFVHKHFFPMLRIGSFAKGGNVRSLYFRVLISKENDISKSPNFRAYDEGAQLLFFCLGVLVRLLFCFFLLSPRLAFFGFWVPYNTIFVSSSSFEFLPFLFCLWTRIYLSTKSLKLFNVPSVSV
jgi:hypothetical protein